MLFSTIQTRTSSSIILLSANHHVQCQWIYRCFELFRPNAHIHSLSLCPSSKFMVDHFKIQRKTHWRKFTLILSSRCHLNSNENGNDSNYLKKICASFECVRIARWFFPQITEFIKFITATDVAPMGKTLSRKLIDEVRSACELEEVLQIDFERNPKETIQRICC